MSLTTVEIAALGFATIGAIVAGNAARQVAQRNGCTDAECTAAGAVAVGLSMAVIPAAAAAGTMIVATKGFEAWKNRTSIIANAKAKTEETMSKVTKIKAAG